MTRILIRRTGALGDVLCTTPVMARLAREIPDAEIHVETEHPSVLIGNPLIAACHVPGQARGSFDLAINLDLAYERQPRMHVVDAYMLAAFGNKAPPRDNQLFLDYEKSAAGPRVGGRTITIHAAGRTWPSRALPREFWAQVTTGLAQAGYHVVFVGAAGDLQAEAPNVSTMVGRLSLRETARLIAESACFVGSDSALVHIAGCTETPIVGLYTSVLGAFRAPFRHGLQSWRAEILDAGIECRGCLASAPPPATYVSCRRGDNACVRTFDPAVIVQKSIGLASLRTSAT